MGDYFFVIFLILATSSIWLFNKVNVFEFEISLSMNLVIIPSFRLSLFVTKFEVSSSSE